MCTIFSHNAFMDLISFSNTNNHTPHGIDKKPNFLVFLALVKLWTLLLHSHIHTSRSRFFGCKFRLTNVSFEIQPLRSQLPDPLNRHKTFPNYLPRGNTSTPKTIKTRIPQDPHIKHSAQCKHAYKHCPHQGNINITTITQNSWHSLSQLSKLMIVP